MPPSMASPEPLSPPSDELLELVDDGDGGAVSVPAGPPAWRVLVVDDEPDVFTATALNLHDSEIDGRALQLIPARSAQQAEQLIAQDPDIAAVLLDVVMETPDAGLRLVERIRAMSGRAALRIILRTGQPGYAPELEVIRRYDINDYRTKSELTQTRLLTTLTVALRGYQQLRRIESHQRGLEKVVAATGSLITERGSMQRFAEGVLTQICAITEARPEGVIVLRHSPADAQQPQIVAAAGFYRELLGQPAQRLPAELQEALSAAEGQDITQHGTHSALRVKASDGDELLVLFSTGAALDAEARQLLALFAINTALGFDSIKSFRELDHYAYHDRETGLINRAGLKREVQQARGQLFAQLKVGELHEIRGALGESVARRALADLGQRLGQLLGEEGRVARIQGDRLVLSMDSAAGPRLLPRVQEVLAAPLTVGELSLQLPMALGWSEGQDSVDQAIDEAGLVVAHLPPGRQVRSARFSAGLRARVQERMGLLGDLRQALEEDRIAMFLQPQVRLSDRQFVGAEALVRWFMRDGRIVMPSHFIPVLEHTGAVLPLGQRMLERALACLAGWPDPAQRISVNVSVRQLEEPDFAAWVCNRCDAAGVARQRLRLEITESAFALDAEQVGATLALLAEAGFPLCIDDFGTGHSSLGRLAEIPVSELKLDRSLVRGIESDPRARRVARLIVELGRDLGVEVLAEGIETEGQLAVLRELGCALGQGWLFGRPVAAAALQR